MRRLIAWLAVVFVATATVAGAADYGAIFTAAVGERIAGTENCHVANDRYIACFQLTGDGELARIVVEPIATLTNDEFDRDRSLSYAEFLDLFHRLERVETLGFLLEQPKTKIHAVSNDLWVDSEDWEHGVIETAVNTWDQSILHFRILFYLRRRGIVWLTRQPECDDATSIFRPLFNCDGPSNDPQIVAIDEIEYWLAPEDRRCFYPGELVDVHVATTFLSDPPTTVVVETQ